jgi:predicted nucleic acid-binding Zn ribbon protein
MSELPFGDAIKEFLERSKLNNGVKALKLTDTWEQLMGKTIARYTDKIELVNRTLFIHTNVAPLRQELMYQREKIIERVNESLGPNTINEVVIR